MHLKLTYVLLCSFTFSYFGVNAYKYLAVLPTASRSHFIVGSSLMRALAQKGHEVYVISPYPLKEFIPNYHDIPIPSTLTAAKELIDKLFASNKKSVLHNSIAFYEMGLHTTEAALREPTVQQLMSSNHTFDAVICEVFVSEALFGLSEHFKCPLIGLGAFGATPWTTDMVGSPLPPSYVPSAMLKFSDHMTLIERMVNLAFVTFQRLLMDFYSLPRHSDLYRKYFPHLERDMYDVRKNAALVLVNTHVSLAPARAYVPNQIEVGGMHINRQVKPLPSDIVQFIEGSPHGVIYFSMGSNLKSKDMPAEIMKDLLKVFRGLKHRVLWKFEDVELMDRPDNVFISDWFPQDDILAHDNVKVFITHGGLLSITESIYHRTPIIGIPIFADQFLNMARAEENGYGIMLDFKTLNADRLLQALERVLNDGTFRDRITEVSDRYRDQEMLPMDKAIYWVEHVVRHRGAKYMHCAGLDLSFIEYHNIDVIFILAGGLLLLLLIMGYVLRLLLKVLWRIMPSKIQTTKPKMR